MQREVYTYDIEPGNLRGLGIKELWHYRHLAGLLAWRNVRIRYKQTVLGMAWGVLAPIAYTVIFLLLFRLMSVRAAGDLPYVPAVFTGMTTTTKATTPTENSPGRNARRLQAVPRCARSRPCAAG